jgi:hypothetical protein
VRVLVHAPITCLNADSLVIVARNSLKQTPPILVGLLNESVYSYLQLFSVQTGWQLINASAFVQASCWAPDCSQTLRPLMRLSSASCRPSDAVLSLALCADGRENDGLAHWGGGLVSQQPMRGSFLFEKVLTVSDTSPLRRIILPKVGLLLYSMMILSAVGQVFWLFL